MDAPPPAPRLSLGAAREAAERLLGRLERCEAALRLVLTGPVRRMEPWPGRVDLLATAHAVEPVLQALVEAPAVAEVLARGPAEATVRLRDGTLAHLEVLADEADLPVRWLATTGPAAHREALAARAAARGLRLDERRLVAPEGALPLLEEHGLYDALGLPWCPPERRGARLAEAPDDMLLPMRAVRGAAGLATRASTGRYSLAEMAARAEREGYAWAVALDEPPPAAQADAAARAAFEEAREAEAQAWNDEPEHGVRVHAATWLAVDAEGRVHGPPPPEGAPRLAVAVLRAEGPVDGATLTRRLRRAAADPRVDALSLRLPPGAGALDVQALAAVLGPRGPALWVAPPPWHAEPEPDLLVAAEAAGAPLLLSAEARDLVGLDGLLLAAGLARRAGVPTARVLNTGALADLEAWLTARRAARPAAGGGA